MKFSDHIPTDLNDNPNWEKLVVILDELHTYKKSLLDSSMRYVKPPLCFNLPYLRKKVVDLGYEPVPDDFPAEILYAMILNAENVMALKGSREGLKYWLWVLTFGEMAINDTDFYPVNDYIIPSDDYAGFLSHTLDNLEAYNLFLFSGFDNFGYQVLGVEVFTKFHALQSLLDYINEHIYNYISFVDDNAIISITLSPGVYTTYSEPYQYFVK